MSGLTSSPGSSGAATGMLGEREVIRNAGKQAIVSFLKAQTCYAVLRASGKVVVFDTRIPIQLAFYALVEHGENAFIILNYEVLLFDDSVTTILGRGLYELYGGRGSVLLL